MTKPSDDSTLCYYRLSIESELEKSTSGLFRFK